MAKKRILIVDDDASLQAFLKKRLEARGFDCLSVFTVEAALRGLEAIRPDLILLDLGFQKIDGVAFLQHARQWLPADWELPPVVIISGFSEKEIVDYCLDTGASGFIAKPFEPDQLMQIIDGYL